HNDIEWTIRNRRWPADTSTSASITRQPFGVLQADRSTTRPYKSCRWLPIPGMINGYNFNIGGVDIADQLQALFNTQQRTQRNWMPLFHWLLDTSIVNAF